jgi:hypothetical protein
MGGILEFALQLLAEVLLDTAFSGGAALLLRPFEESLSDEQFASKKLAMVGHFLLGAMAGGISVLILPHRLAPYRLFPGASLLFAPFLTGAALEWAGRQLVRRGRTRISLFTFSGGMLFAVGMGIVRLAFAQ